MAANTDPWTRRLRRFGPLEADDEAWLGRVVSRAIDVPDGHDLKEHGERPDTVHVVLDGMACRYKILADGRRQIMAFLVPGDSCDLHTFLLDRMDHGLCTLARSRVATIAGDEILAATARRPLLTRAFWMSTLVDEAILREWLVNLGQRDAYERMAHLLWELYLRHAAVGLTRGGMFELPLTQRELADALGLSPVHVNRTLRRLRSDGVLQMRGRVLRILNPEALKQISGFEADYLHMDEAEPVPFERRLSTAV